MDADHPAGRQLAADAAEQEAIKDRRGSLIGQLRQDGWTLAAIGRAAGGISPEAVGQALDRAGLDRRTGRPLDQERRP